MPEVGRYAKMIAKPGRGDDLAAAMLAVAAALQDFPGCDLYVVNRELDDPETIWVTELWRSQEDVDAALQGDAAEASIAAVRDLMDAFERIDLEPLGGVGHLQAEAGFTAIALDAVEDQAAKHGLGEMGEARFAHGDLDARQTGMSLQRLRPGRRQMFAHHHRRAEEVYVVLSGSGRARIDDEVVDLGPRDALRIAPASTRIFEAGPEGLELLVVGPRVAGDAVPVQDFGLD